MFLHDDFLLKTKTAKRLYHEYAAKMPIVDYHCHANANEIADDITYENITQAWISLDHYKWTVMRSCGIEESRITGASTDKEKFFAFAQCLPRCIGSPMYHRSHIELKNYFGYTGILSEKTAEEAWVQCNKAVADLSAKKLIKLANVKLIGTTDDILETLAAHDAIAADRDFDVRVVPTFRTDSVVNIDLPGYREYIVRLGEATGVQIRKFTDLMAAIDQRMEYFERRGCHSIDQALMYVPCYEYTEAEIDRIFAKVMGGGAAEPQETAVYLNALLNGIAHRCHERNWVMQLHVGTKRDVNTRLLREVGVDVGGDCIGDFGNLGRLPFFFNRLEEQGELPKTVIYSINPADNPVIDSLIGCFMAPNVVGKIQHGAAWWFNDNQNGIRNHLASLSSMNVLGNFIGSLTDSRTFIHYSRHEYFRRILCDMLGTLIEDGEYPDDMEVVGAIVEDICANNALRYYNFI